MIVYDLDIFSACFRPPEAHTQLIVHTDAVLADAIALQGLQRLPGGIRRSSNRAAISNWRSLRRAMVAIVANRLTRSPFERARVSSHLKLLITHS